MAVRYLRVVVAVPEEDLEELELALDLFLEEAPEVAGAYVSAPYDTRDEALAGPWADR